MKDTMKVLVTGSAGFIGKHVVKRLEKAGHEVVPYDNKRDPVEDIRDEETLVEKMYGCNAVIHLAAMISVQETLSFPEKTTAVNVGGSRNVLTAAKKTGVKKVVLASTAAVYGMNPTTPTVEEAPLEPASPYGASKKEMEWLTTTYDAPVACLRFFNVYGPGQDPASQYAAAIPAFITRALDNQPLTIYGDGEQTRDFIFVEDVARACLIALEQGSGSYNIATGKAITIKALAEKIITLARSKSEIVYEPAREGDPKESLASVEKAKEELDFTAQTSLDDGLQATIEYFKKKV